jgi:hypothetical protein
LRKGCLYGTTVKVKVFELLLMKRTPSPLTWRVAKTKYLSGSVLGAVKTPLMIASCPGARRVMEVLAELTSPAAEMTRKMTRTKA